MYPVWPVKRPLLHFCSTFQRSQALPLTWQRLWHGIARVGGEPAASSRLFSVSIAELAWTRVGLFGKGFLLHGSSWHFCGLCVSGAIPIMCIDEYASKPVLVNVTSLVYMMVNLKTSGRGLKPLGTPTPWYLVQPYVWGRIRNIHYTENSNHLVMLEKNVLNQYIKECLLLTIM